MPTTKKQTPRKPKQSKRPAPKKKPAAKPKAPPLAAVEKALRDMPGIGLSRIAKRARRDKPDVARALAVLRAAGKIAMTGRARAATYRTVTTTTPPTVPPPYTYAA